MQRTKQGDGYAMGTPRKIATEIGKQIVYRAMLLRKGAISVAREAYARKDRISV